MKFVTATVLSTLLVGLELILVSIALDIFGDVKRDFIYRHVVDVAGIGVVFVCSSIAIALPFLFRDAYKDLTKDK